MDTEDYHIAVGGRLCMIIVRHINSREVSEIQLGLERNYLAACPAHAARRSNVCRPVAQAYLHRLNHLRLVGRRDGSRAARIVADVERSVLLQKLVAHISRILRLKG